MPGAWSIAAVLKYCRPRPETRGSFPPWLRVFLSAGALGVCWSAAGQPSSRPPAPAHVLLRLRTGAYDPLRTPSIANLALAPGVPASSPGLYVVQFSGPIRPEWRRALEAAGAAVLEYLPDFAYLVRASASTAARFGSLPGHHWHGAFEGVRRAAGGTALAAHPPSVGTRRLRSQHGGPMLLDVMTLPGEDVRAVARRIPGRVVQRFARRRGFLRV